MLTQQRTPNVFVNVPPPPSAYPTKPYYQGWIDASQQMVTTDIPDPIPTIETVFETTIYQYICNSVWKYIFVTGDARSLQICSIRGVSDFAITQTFSGLWNSQSSKAILKANGVYMRKTKGRWYVHVPIRALFSQELHILFGKE